MGKASFKQAVSLKELGFNEPCYSSFTEDEREIEYTTGKFYFPIPLHQQIVEWLRVQHGIWVEVIMTYPNKWEYNIYKIDTYELLCQMHSQLNSPQEAYSTAFDYILPTLK